MAVIMAEKNIWGLSQTKRPVKFLAVFCASHDLKNKQLIEGVFVREIECCDRDLQLAKVFKKWHPMQDGCFYPGPANFQVWFLFQASVA